MVLWANGWSSPWESVLFWPPCGIRIEDCSRMPGKMAHPRTASFLILAFAVLTPFSLPRLTQGGQIEALYITPSDTVTATSTSNAPSTYSMGNQTAPTVNASSSWQWNLFVPVLVLVVGVTLTITVAAAIVVKRRHATRTMPQVHLICPRCRTPISPYDSACSNCRTLLYHPYRYYQQRR
jgi:hypothetical protein